MKQLRLAITALVSMCSAIAFAQSTDPTPYCPAAFDDAAGFPVEHYISRVTFGTLDNNTGTIQFPGMHYAYYNTLTAPSLNRGSSYTLTVEHDAGMTVHFVGVYIDFNQNNDFSDPGELVLSQGPFGSVSPATILVPIPAGATLGTTRMRVMVFEDDAYTFAGAVEPSPCTFDATPFFDWGEAEDYNINITDPAPCDPVTTVTPSAITESSATIAWPAATGTIVGYEWLINTTSTSPTGAGTPTTSTSASSTTLLPSTTYYAHVRVRCSGTSYSTWVNVPFTTTAPPPCDTMTGLSVGGITLSSATISWDAAVGTILGYQYVVNTSAADPTGAGTPTTATSADVSGLAMGTTYYAHVRVRCSTFGYSSWVTVPFTTAAPIPCATPTGLTATSITSSGAVVGWTGVAGAIAYEYVVNGFAADPTGSGTSTTATSVSVGSLAASTTYYLHVRAQCDPFSFSSWVTIPFTTLAFTVPCDPVSWISFSTVSSTSVTFNWSAILSTSVGYKYVVDNNLASPTVAGTYTTLTSATVTGLTSGTTYYAHVRDTCGPGNLSNWITKQFTTPTGLSVADAASQNFDIQVYPNPVSEEVNIKITNPTNADNASLIITDISGRLIKSVNVKEGVVSLDMTSQAAGIYIVKYNNGAESKYIRFVKQ